MVMAKNSRKSGGGGHRVTVAEQESRIEQIELCLGRGWNPGEIKRFYTTHWKVSRASVERYLSRARENLLSNLETTRDEHRSRSLLFYQSVLADDTESTRNKLTAQKNIDRLLGLPQPILVAQTTPEGKSLLEAARDLTEEQAIALASLRHAVG